MSEWQPIETAPKDGTMILAAFPWLPYPKPIFWAKYAKAWRCPATEHLPRDIEGPTYWQSLPALPFPQDKGNC